MLIVFKKRKFLFEDEPNAGWHLARYDSDAGGKALCVPSVTPRSIFGRHLVLSFVIFFFLNMLSYHLCIKTFLWNIYGNMSVLSRYDSHLRGPANLKNSWQVIVYMVSLTNKQHPADLPLDDNFTAGNKLFKFWVSTRMYWNSLIANLRCSNQLVFGVHKPTYTISGSWKNLGILPRRKLCGGGGLVRRLGQRRFSSNSSIIENTCASLKELMEINKDTKHSNYFLFVCIFINLVLGVRAA